MNSIHGLLQRISETKRARLCRLVGLTNGNFLEIVSKSVTEHNWLMDTWGVGEGVIFLGASYDWAYEVNVLWKFIDSKVDSYLWNYIVHG